MSNSICDKYTFTILSELLENSQGLRFKEIRMKVTTTDPIISSRLSLLKKYNLVEVSPIVDDDNDEKYFVYRISKEGRKFAESIKIKQLVRHLDKIDRSISPR